LPKPSLAENSEPHALHKDRAVRATHGLSRLPDPRLPKFALFLLKRNRSYYTLSVADTYV